MTQVTTATMMEKLLTRKVIWSGSGRDFEQFLVGYRRTIYVRCRKGRLSDVMDNPLTIDQIQAETD